MCVHVRICDLYVRVYACMYVCVFVCACVCATAVSVLAIKIILQLIIRFMNDLRRPLVCICHLHIGIADVGGNNDDGDDGGNGGGNNADNDHNDINCARARHGINMRHDIDIGIFY